MRWLRRLLHALRGSAHDADLRAEIEAHRVLRQEALEREGLSPADAAAASRRAVGNVTLAVEDARDVWVVRALDHAWQDARAAARGLTKSPAFALVTIATLALGIGANTALFSIFNSLILRPLPVRDPGSLVLLADGSWTYPIWQELRRLDGPMFDGALAWSQEDFDLARSGKTDPVSGAFVSGRFFEVLGVGASRGRMLTPADDATGSADAAVAVISHRFWQRHFAGASDVVGRSLTLHRVSFTVVGVMPPGFHGVTVGDAVDVMVPFSAEPLVRGRESFLAGRSTWWLEVMARLKPGQTVEQATTALRGVQPQVREATLPDWPKEMLARYLDEPFTLVSAATGTSDLRSRFETPLSAMVVAVGLVLLVACANIASLLVARALARRRELSVRLALGGSRWRLARLLFAEALLVSVTGAALGLLFARWSSALLIQQLSTWGDVVSLDLDLDWRVLAFTAALTCLCAVVAGVAPVLGLKSVAPGDALKDAGRGIAGDRSFSLRGTLVVAQVALSLVLVVAAGLFLRTFTTLTRLPLGFTPEPLLVVEVNLRSVDLPAEERGALALRLRDRVATVSGVQSAALSAIAPVSGSGWNSWVGDSPTPPDRSYQTWLNATTPGWFTTMGMPMLSGRDFDSTDRQGGTQVAIVNDSFVRRFLPGRTPVGLQVRTGGRAESPFEIVGVIADAVYGNPREGMMPTMYLPLAQRPQTFPRIALIVATRPGQRAAVEREVAAAMKGVDPSIAFEFRTFDQLISATVTQERLVAMLAAFFGGLALLLAGIGLYGVVAQAVRARRVEIGVRMALGAAPPRIVRLVFTQVGVLLAIGVALGLVAGLWAARYVETMLFRVEPRDAATFAAAAAVLLTVGVLAAWLPARRAARLDPASVLRED